MHIFGIGGCTNLGEKWCQNTIIFYAEYLCRLVNIHIHKAPNVQWLDVAYKSPSTCGIKFSPIGESESTYIIQSYNN